MKDVYSDEEVKDCRVQDPADLVFLLDAAASAPTEAEREHAATRALLQYIGDERVTSAYNRCVA